MAISTYGDILRQVQMWANRTDLTDEQYNSFIFFAGNIANQLLRVPAMESTVILEVTPDGHINIPFDFLELRSMTFAWGTEDSKPLSRISWDQFVNYYNSPSSDSTGVNFFSRQGAFWFISSKPETGAKVTVHYYRAMPEINTTEQTNWLSDLSPMTYIFGALHYLYMFVQDEERASYWKTLFNEELNRIQMLSDNAEYKGTALAVRARNILGE